MMRISALIACLLSFAFAGGLFGQHPSGIVTSGPIPEMKVYTPEGDEVEVKELVAGKWTVLSGGCLSCPQFHQGFPEIEAAAKDYREKGVQFYFFYKSLRHPELNGYVDAQNLKERLMQLQAAKEQLGTTLPWLADSFENEMRDGLGAGANSVWLISPKGEIVFGQERISAGPFREALTKHVGTVEKPTLADDLEFPRQTRSAMSRHLKSPVLVERPMGLQILKTTPENPDETYYVKLRVEAEPEVLSSGKGRVFLGFYPDPIHGARWNNLTEPMKYELTLPVGVKATPASAQAAKAEGDKDNLPRQFWIEVDADGKPDPITLTMHYFACTEKMCIPATHKYTIEFEVDQSGARTAGFNPNRGGKGRGGKGGKGGMKGKGKGKGMKGRGRGE